MEDDLESELEGALTSNRLSLSESGIPNTFSLLDRCFAVMVIPFLLRKFHFFYFIIFTIH